MRSGTLKSIVASLFLQDKMLTWSHGDTEEMELSFRLGICGTG